MESIGVATKSVNADLAFSAVLTENCVSRPFQRGKLILDNLPNALVFNQIVPVNRQVVEGDDSCVIANALGDRRIVFCNPVHGFTDDLEVPFDRLTQSAISFEVSQALGADHSRIKVAASRMSSRSLNVLGSIKRRARPVHFAEEIGAPNGLGHHPVNLTAQEHFEFSLEI